nr:DMT family transporter [Rhizobacter sp. Root404]
MSPLSPAAQGGVTNLVLGALCGFMVALVWAGWSVATRFAVTTNLGPADVTFLRFGVSSLLLWPVLIRHRAVFWRIGALKLLVMLTGAGVPFMFISSTGMRFAPASHVATLMIGVMPLFVAMLSAGLFGERFTKAQLMGMGVVLAGVVAIGGESLLFNRNGGEWRGDLLFLFAGLLFASYTLAQRRSGLSSWQATAVVNVGSCVLFAPIYLLCLQPRIFSAPIGAVLFQAAAQGVGVAILGLFFYAEASRRLGATRAAIFGALVPALAALIGVPVLHEVPSWATGTGIALVMIGVLLVVTGVSIKKK